MYHSWKNGLHFKNVTQLEKSVTLKNVTQLEKSVSLFNVSHLKKWVTLKKCVTVGKWVKLEIVAHSWKNGSHSKTCVHSWKTVT